MKPAASSSLVRRAEALTFLAGLLLFAVGLSWAWLPLGPIGAGAILLAVSLFGGGKTQ